jgi:hypothetical protein
MINLRTGWREIIERWNVDSVLLPRDCALAQALALDPAWRAPYGDSKAVVFVRRSSEVENASISPETLAGTLRK